MARVMIREAHGGETREISDRALSFFPGWVILATSDDSASSPPLYLSREQSDLRYLLRSEAPTSGTTSYDGGLVP